MTQPSKYSKFFENERSAHPTGSRSPLLYLVTGSEDGPIAIATSATRALIIAGEYAGDTIKRNDVRRHTLFENGYVQIAACEGGSDVTADITTFTPNHCDVPDISGPTSFRMTRDC